MTTWSRVLIWNLFQIMVNTKTIAQIIIFGIYIIYEKKVYKYLLKNCKCGEGGSWIAHAISRAPLTFLCQRVTSRIWSSFVLSS